MFSEFVLGFTCCSCLGIKATHRNGIPRWIKNK